MPSTSVGLLDLRLLSYFISAIREAPDETVHMHRLIGTFAGHLCPYVVHMSREGSVETARVLSRLSLQCSPNNEVLKLL